MGAATEGSGAGNRITQPWGARRPYGPEDAWPVRVDTFLDGGVAEAQVDRWVQSACVLRSNGCGLDIAVAGGRMVGVRGRAGDRVDHGRLGPKGLFGWQANLAADRQPGRWSARVGRWSRATGTPPWSGSSGGAASSWTPSAPGSIGFYTSGQLFLEEYYTWP